MKICYLLESTELSGGVRIVFDQARALQKKGHFAYIRSLGGDHSWYHYPVNVYYVSHLERQFDNGFAPDVLICTFWSTVEPGLKLKINKTFHLCQGYEGDFPEWYAIQEEIKVAYSQKIPKLTIGEWITQQLIKNFGDNLFPIYCIGQIVDTKLYKPARFNLPFLNCLRKISKPEILLVGDFSIYSKGIKDGLKAIARLRQKGYSLFLTRVAVMNENYFEEELITNIDNYYYRLTPRQMAKVYQRADILLAPTRFGEGFGLPFAESLACGLPAVATRIPSYLSFNYKADYACFVDVYDYESMAKALGLLIDNCKYRVKLQKKGPKLIKKNFSSDIVARNLLNAFQLS